MPTGVGAQTVIGAAPPRAPQSATASDSGVNSAAQTSSEITSATPTSRDQSQGNVLGEVVVTARKRTENLQNVPVAATVLSGAELSKQNAVTVTDLGLTVPNFRVQPSTGSGTAPALEIRGQVQNDTVATLDPSVGVYVDGIYWSRAVGANAALADVSGVEVLEGPQGTLFGRNTTGGALNIHTNDPDLRHYSGVASVSGGSYSELDGGVVLNAPIVEDKLAVRAVFQHNGHDGYVYDEVRNERLNSQDEDTIRIKVLAQPTDKLRILASYETFDANQEEAPWQLTYVQPANFATGKGAGAIDALVTNGGSLTQYVGGSFRTSYGNDPSHVDARTQTLGLTGSYDLGFAVLKLIGGYRKEDSSNNEDLDGTPYTLLSAPLQTDIEETTGEAQLSGKLFDQRLTYVAGYFWFKESGSDMSEADALTAINPDYPNIQDGFIKNRSQAVYAQGTYKITDALSLTGGLRYSADEKALISHNGAFVQNAAGGAATFECLVPAELGNPSQAACSQEFNTSSSDVDYTADLDYKFTSDILGYVKVSHGYRAGGDNIRGSVTAASFAPFAPETALNYEVGLKSEYFQHRLRVNADGFYTNYDNIQRTIDVAAAGGGISTLVANAASGKVYGGELQIEALLVHGLRLGANLGVTDASYNQYQDELGNHVNEPFPYTPEFTYSLTGDYTHDVPRGSVNFHADWGWQSSEIPYAVGYTNGGSDAVNFPTSSIRQSLTAS